MELLESTIDPMITEIVDQTMFQHDCVPPHYANQVREFLNERFPTRWIGRRDAIEWPALLWGHLKSTVYATQAETI